MKLPGSFQTYFPVLHPINQGYICVGWTSTRRGGGGPDTVLSCVRTHISRWVCICACCPGACIMCTFDHRGATKLCAFVCKGSRRSSQSERGGGQHSVVHCPTGQYHTHKTYTGTVLYRLNQEKDHFSAPVQLCSRQVYLPKLLAHVDLTDPWETPPPFNSIHLVATVWLLRLQPLRMSIHMNNK